jgi:hypothetical protein
MSSGFDAMFNSGHQREGGSFGSSSSSRAGRGSLRAGSLGGSLAGGSFGGNSSRVSGGSLSTSSNAYDDAATAGGAGVNAVAGINLLSKGLDEYCFPGVKDGKPCSKRGNDHGTEPQTPSDGSAPVRIPPGAVPFGNLYVEGSERNRKNAEKKQKSEWDTTGGNTGDNGDVCSNPTHPTDNTRTPALLPIHSCTTHVSALTVNAHAVLAGLLIAESKKNVFLKKTEKLKRLISEDVDRWYEQARGRLMKALEAGLEEDCLAEENQEQEEQGKKQEKENENGKEKDKEKEQEEQDPEESRGSMQGEMKTGGEKNENYKGGSETKLDRESEEKLDGGSEKKLQVGSDSEKKEQKLHASDPNQGDPIPKEAELKEEITTHSMKPIAFPESDAASPNDHSMKLIPFPESDAPTTIATTTSTMPTTSAPPNDPMATMGIRLIEFPAGGNDGSPSMMPLGSSASPPVFALGGSASPSLMPLGSSASPNSLMQGLPPSAVSPLLIPSMGPGGHDVNQMHLGQLATLPEDDFLVVPLASEDFTRERFYSSDDADGPNGRIKLKILSETIQKLNDDHKCYLSNVIMANAH